MKYILFDDSARLNLLPFTFTRPVAALRMGILTAQERWEKWLKSKTFIHTEKYLQKKIPLFTEPDHPSPPSPDVIMINAAVLPDEKLMDSLRKIQPGEVLVKDDLVIFIRLTKKGIENTDLPGLKNYRIRAYTGEALTIRKLWDLFNKNGAAIALDFNLLTNGKKSQPISRTNRVLGKKNIFLKRDTRVENAMLNGTTGPIYIEKGAEVMEGALLRGPIALCEGAQVKMGAKIYGPTTIGPYSKVGGEVNNCIFFGFSNKAHDGFLGNSIIGEWCNIGAGTNNSNLKNNYSETKVWSYATEKFEPTGLQFCGLFMGDHSKCGINTMFNTGTVVGVSANVFGTGFPRKFIPSYTWGGTQGFQTYRIEDALETARNMMERRGISLSGEEEEILKQVFELTRKFRKI